MDKQICSYMTLIGVPECMVLLIQNTVNREYFIVKILFRIAWLIRKLTVSFVQNFIARNILDTKYLRLRGTHEHSLYIQTLCVYIVSVHVYHVLCLDIALSSVPIPAIHCMLNTEKQLVT